MLEEKSFTVVFVSAGRIDSLAGQCRGRGSVPFIWQMLQITFCMKFIKCTVEWVKVPNIECGAERSHGGGGGRAGFENWILFSVIITGG